MISQLMERDHQQLSALLNDLRWALGEPWQTHTFELLDLFWARLAVHIRAENLCLFPAVLTAAAGRSDDRNVPDELKFAVETLRSDHNFFMEQLSQAVNMLRDAQSNPNETQSIARICAEVRGIIAAVSERLHEHDRLEEEQVYRWTDEILSANELETLRAALKYELENMPPRFASSEMKPQRTKPRASQRNADRDWN